MTFALKSTTNSILTILNKTFSKETSSNAVTCMSCVRYTTTLLALACLLFLPDGEGLYYVIFTKTDHGIYSIIWEKTLK